jgi:hypothetical protein
MKKHRIPEVEESSLRELDAVVAAVIEADQRRLPSRAQSPSRGRDERHSPEEESGRVAPFKYPGADTSPASQRSQEPEDAGLGAPSPESQAGVDDQQAEAADPAALDPMDQGLSETHPDLGELLSLEEERFIVNIVGWLRPRPHKDVIIAQIWNRLTESEPESFYALEAEDNPAAEKAAEAKTDQTTEGQPTEE